MSSQERDPRTDVLALNPPYDRLFSGQTEEQGNDKGITRLPWSWHPRCRIEGIPRWQHFHPNHSLVSKPKEVGRFIELVT